MPAPALIDHVPGESLLWKYRSARDAMQRERVRDILVNHRLYCASPQDLNDPFECVAKFSFQATEEQKMQRAIARIQKENPEMLIEDARAQAPQRCRILEESGVKNMKKWIFNSIGFISFGGMRDNLLMWSHYADAHAGICIEFGASRLEHSQFFGNAMQVEYRDELPVVNVYKDDLIEQARAHIATKSKHWEYEKEWRIIVKDRIASSYYHFPADIISAIYLGCRATDETRNFVKECIEQRSVSIPLYQAKPSDSAYGLEFDRIS